MNQCDEWLGKLTTINFKGDLKMDSSMRDYDAASEFLIVRQQKNGLFELQDTTGKSVRLKKSNINYFNK
jgi:hypothetical protein